MKHSNILKCIGAVVAGLATSVLIISCAPFLDSPFSDQLLRSLRNYNNTSIEKMNNIESDGVIRFAIFTDSHQIYKDLDQVIRQINRTSGLDFVANIGDFTNSGYNLEYDQFVDSCEFLKLPMVTAMGNHDAIGAGPTLFKKVFGEPNYWFESASYRFIFFHSANLEDPKSFSMAWLKSTVDNSTKPVLIFTHAPLNDPERFTGDDATLANAVVADPKTKIVFNGHNHVYLLNNQNGTVLLQAGRVEGFQWLIIEIQGTQLKIQRMDNGEITWITLKS